MAQTEVERILSEGKSIYKVTDKATGESHYETGSRVVGGDKNDPITYGAATGTTIYRKPDGTYTSEPNFGVTFNSDTGKIQVTIPDTYKDDEIVQKITDNYILTNLSSNYKTDKNVTYQNPYNETEKIDTAKLVEYFDSALKDRVESLYLTPKAQKWLLTNFGNSEKAIDVINSLSPENMVTMTANGSAGDDSPVSIPKYIQDAFPKIKELESYSNGYAKKKDILDNWYNLSNGGLTKEEALALEKYYATEALQKNIENMDADELAKTVAFGQFLATNDPTMSAWDAFWTNTGEFITGFNEGLYGSVATLMDSMLNIVSIPQRAVMGAMTGTVLPAMPYKETLWSDHKVAAPNFSEQLLEDTYINSAGATALGIGYGAGKLAYTLADITLTNAAFSAMGGAISQEIVEKGAEKVAIKIAEEADSAVARSGSKAIANIGKEATKSAKVYNFNAAETQLFKSIVDNAAQISRTVLKVTDAQLSLMTATELTNVLNSAMKVMNVAKLANSAVGVMSSFTIAATLNNNELTNKIIRNPNSDADLRVWLQQMALDTLSLEAIGAIGKIEVGLVGKSIKGTPFETFVNTARDKTSKFAEKATDTIVSPISKLREWANNRKIVAQQMKKAGVSNARLANQRALRESRLVRDFRSWMQTQTTMATSSAAGAAILGTTDAAEAVYDLTKGTNLGVTSALDTTVYDPVTETSYNISPFAAAKAGEVRLRNVLTDIEDIQTLETQLISQFADPDIEPVISDRMNIASDADTKLINMETEAGLLSKQTVKTDKKLIKQSKKEPYNALFAGHSAEVVKFAVRSQELYVKANELRAMGVEPTVDVPEYKQALERYNKAAEDLPKNIIDQINNEVLPAYRELSYEVTNYGLDPRHAIFPRDLINGLRASGKWGEDGRGWIRLASAKEMPKGIYVPRDGLTDNTTVADMRRDKVLEDDQITWIGNGFNALIREIALTESYKRMASAIRQADNLYVGVVKSGAQTRAASNVKEYEKDFHEAVKAGIESFTEDMSQSRVVSKLLGKKPAVTAEGSGEIVGELPSGAQPKLVERGPIILGADLEHTRASGIMSMDGTAVREAMVDDKVSTSDSIIDQDSFNEYYLQSTDAAKKVLADNFSNDVIADYRAYLNSTLPGFDVLEWGLLGRYHTNELYPGGLYEGINSTVKVYSMGIRDLKKLIGQTNHESRSEYAIEKVKKHINTRDKNGLLPLNLSYDDGKFRLELRWYDDTAVNRNDWEDYLNDLEYKGITTVPVAVTADPGALHREYLSTLMLNFVNAIDASVATGEKPEFDTYEVAQLILAPGYGEKRLRERIDQNISKEVMPAGEIDKLFSDANKLIGTVKDGFSLFKKVDADEKTNILDKAIKQRLDNGSLQDITNEVKQAAADYDYIPWFHNQRSPLGSAEFNAEPPTGDDRYFARNGIGDAMWVAPNASYTNTGEYGKNQTIANINKKYFMSDKEMKGTLGKLRDRLDVLKEKMLKKMQTGGKPKAEFFIPKNTPERTLEVLDKLENEGIYPAPKSMAPSDVYQDEVYMDYNGNLYRSVETIKNGEEGMLVSPLNKTIDLDKIRINSTIFSGPISKYLTKKEQKEVETLGKIFFSSDPDTYSYRALAEYTGKPIIDTTMDMGKKKGINGTAFFYYKGVSPEFDADLNNQLQLQSMFDRKSLRWTEDQLANAMELYDGMSLDEMIDYITTGEGWGEDWETALEDFENGEISSSELTEDFEERIGRVAKKNPGIAKIMKETWDNQPLSSDLRDMKFKYWNPSTGYPTIDDADAEVFLEEMGETPNGQPREPISEGQQSMWDAIDPTNPNNVPTSNFTKRNMVDYEKLSEMRGENSANVQELLDEADKLNAYSKLSKKNKGILERGEKLNKDIRDFWKENIYDVDFSYEVKPVETKTKGKRGEHLKYKLDEDRMIEDVDRAIDGMIELVAKDLKSSLYIQGANLLGGYKNSDSRTVFYILSDILSKSNKKVLNAKIKDIAKGIVNEAIPPKQVVIMGNLESLYHKTEKLMKDRMISKLADAKTTLESTGENVESETVKDLLKQYDEDITGYKSSNHYIETTDVNGNHEWLEVSPSVGAVYNERPIYKPMGPIQEALANMALLKRISLTNLSPRSFAKQAASDPALAFATTGALPIPGMYTMTSQAIAAKFGTRIAAQIEKYDPRRYENIKEVARRKGISIEEAAVLNMNAIATTQVPFTTMSQEALRQADANKYGIKGEEGRRGLNDRINTTLKNVSETLGKPNDVREVWNRQNARVKATYDALERGYNYAQAEEFGRHAMNNATTNFRQKHSIFNALRSTVPYLTASISGAKSFWQMFELDPIGVTTRILTGFVMPIVWLMGEIMDDDDLRQQYEDLAESEKEDHLIVSVNGQLIRIPIGEELGSIVNPLMHTVEGLYGENQYSFWLLMLNDLVGFLPTDFTGFTDPEMWEDITNDPPSFLEIMENGVSKVLSATMPPIVQSMYMAAKNRDLYTGRKIDSNKITIDNDGNAVIESWSQSEFARGLAQVVGGDARVIEKTTSSIFGTTALHVLDTITSAIQWVGSGGKSGSLTTAFEKAAQDISSPYSVHGYNSLDRRWNYEISDLYRKKKEIETSDAYRTYNSQISQTADQKARQKKINGRNNLLVNFQNEVEKLVKGYQSRGGTLNSLKFSQVASLLTFEDATRADRAYSKLNTQYSDARAQALMTLYNMGIKNPEGPSSLGYIYFDENGDEQLKVWTPEQMQIAQNIYYQQGDIHQASLYAIIEKSDEGSVKNLKKKEEAAEQPYWDKYNSTGKLTNAEWDAIDDLRKAYNAQLVLAIRDYIDSYGANQILNDETVMDYLENVVKVPSEYEKVNGRYVSSGDGKLNKQQGFARSYLKTIFGVK